jgi:hypothetical protein
MGPIIKKEIEFLCEIAKPDYGYQRTLSESHLGWQALLVF